MDASPGPSPQLLAANEHLHTLRAQRPSRDDSRSSPARPFFANDNPARPPRRSGAERPAATLPAHLGWNSGPLAATLRAAQTHQATRNARQTAVAAVRRSIQEVAVEHTKANASEGPAQLPPTTPVLPDLTAAMLRRRCTAAGRLWWLLRHVDQAGRGWLAVDHVRTRFATRDAPFHLCGARQLHNLLRDGDDLFWRLADGRLWLRSAARVGAALGVTRFTAPAVELPVAALLGPIKRVRAHFYAAFHSARAGRPAGRQTGVLTCRMAGQPIARDTLQRLTGVDPNTQRTYEKLLKLRVSTNLAIGERVRGVGETKGPAQQALIQERAWRHGRSLFILEDRQGRQGPAGRSYLAWQLPNSYGRVHDTTPSRRRKRLNRQLLDLRNKGAGNEQPPCGPTRYLKTAKALRTAVLDRDTYLVSGRYRQGNGRTWSVWSDSLPV